MFYTKIRKLIEVYKCIQFQILGIITKRDCKLLIQRCFYRNGCNPFVLNKVYLQLFRKNDLIMVLFCQGILSAVSLEVLYNKYKCSVFIICVDYSPMTGGCHFIADCKTSEKGCGACECWYSKKEKDFTYENVLEKKRIYQKIKPVVFLNRYMDENYASRSPALENIKKEYLAPVINEELFCPVAKKLAKKELDIDENKKVIFFACQNLNDPKKGGKYVAVGINRLLALGSSIHIVALDYNPIA